ncbi:MAG: DUF5615 family PIN-like protein [Deltaproteobacteria bacterium]|nr:DUF5615 family PIN-like protein [Deltaproteobacteria bacterium]
MKFKLDECLDVRLAHLFSEAGYDARTIFEQNLSGNSDDEVFAACVSEERILVTQDMDFSNPFRFSPQLTRGIIVLRNPSQLLTDTEHLVRQTIRKIQEENPKGHLWVVDLHGIRIWPTDD